MLRGGLTASLAFAVVAIACSSTDSSSSATSSSSSSGGSAPPLDSGACQSRCVAKANACGGVPASSENPGGTDGYCKGVCGQKPTESQMTCLEGKSCAQLASSSLSSLCPGSSGGSSSSSSGHSSSSSSSGSSSSSSGSTAAKKVGDDCTCDKKGGDKGTYAQCLGNVSACFDLKLACLAELPTGEGTCVVSCSEKDNGKTCPSGGRCGSSGKKAIDGGFWYTCQ